MNLQTFWAMVVRLLMDFFKKWLDPIDPTLAPRMGAALSAAVPVGDTVTVGAAPDELKEVVRKLINDIIAKSFSNRPIIASLLRAVANNLPDSLIDNLWDSLFKAGTVSSPKPVRGSFAPPTHEVHPFAAALSAELA